MYYRIKLIIIYIYEPVPRYLPVTIAGIRYVPNLRFALMIHSPIITNYLIRNYYKLITANANES